MTDRRPEYIMAAAMWLDDGEHHDNQPVATGVVLCGFSHAGIISTWSAIAAIIRFQKTVKFLSERLHEPASQ